MCGIVGYVGHRDASEVLLDGLTRLEYRGYDSAGVAILNGNGSITVSKAVGRLAELRKKLEADPIRGHTGLGHTRWATHGVPSERNAHPHLSQDGRLSIIHNGIIENYRELRQELTAAGVEFTSETDSECIAHLVARAYSGDLLKALHQTLPKLEGTYALAVCHEQQPDLIVCTRTGGPLVVGLGDGENFLASDVPALLRYTREILYLEEGCLAEITRDGVALYDRDLKPITAASVTTDLTEDAAEKGGYEHFMLKEIHEQPTAIAQTMRGRCTASGIDLSELGLSLETLKSVKRIQLLACGTSLYSAMVGKYALERYARLPTQAWSASEYRYADPVIDKTDLIVAISQSGETADTIEALKRARAAGARAISICNVMGSSIPRLSDATLYTRAGPEIGVASTKAYTTQLVALLMLAGWMGRALGHTSEQKEKELAQALLALPDQVTWLLEKDIVAVKRCAKRYKDVFNFMYIGRHFNYPTAMEGALKLKEISYIHAEGYAGGEMKHGPLALVEGTFPTIAIAPKGATRAKMISNIQEIKARNGVVVVVSTVGDAEARELADYLIEIPECAEEVSPVLAVVPLQLLAYYTATQLGRDVDKPRNLAKSVTVE